METSLMKILPKQLYSNLTKTSLEVTSNERPRSLFAPSPFKLTWV